MPPLEDKRGPPQNLIALSSERKRSADLPRTTEPSRRQTFHIPQASSHHLNLAFSTAFTWLEKLPSFAKPPLHSMIDIQRIAN